MNSAGMPSRPTLRTALAEKVALAKACVHLPTPQHSCASTVSKGGSPRHWNAREIRHGSGSQPDQQTLPRADFPTASSPLPLSEPPRHVRPSERPLEAVPCSSPYISWQGVKACCRQASMHQQFPSPGRPASQLSHVYTLQLPHAFPPASTVRPQHGRNTSWLALPGQTMAQPEETLPRGRVSSSGNPGSLSDPRLSYQVFDTVTC